MGEYNSGGSLGAKVVASMRGKSNSGGSHGSKLIVVALKG
jgi:hypothetical protein